VLLRLRRGLYAAAEPKGLRPFYLLLKAVSLEVDEVRDILLNVAALKLEAEPAAVGEDLEADPWADAAPAEAPGRRPLDRAGAFAQQLMNYWTDKLRRLSQNQDAVRALGVAPDLIDELVTEIVVGAARLGIADRIAERVRGQVQAANVQWDDFSVSNRAALMATTLLDDYVAFLGFADLAEAARPAFPEPPKPRERGVFQRPGDGAAAPALGPQRTPLERRTFLDWGTALRQLGLDNAGFGGGREIDEAQNRRLGEVLALIAIEPLPGGLPAPVQG
jgi:hypothetical protein